MPTLWAERERGGGADGAPFESKLDAFESWLARAAACAPLPLAAPGAPAASPAAPPRALLLLQDLPCAGGAEGKRRLLAALQRLARGPLRAPCILLLDEAEGGGEEGHLGGRELARALEAGGAASLALNPVTKAELGRALQRVAAGEGLALPAAAAAQIADACRGDARAAVATLQARFGGGGGGGGKAAKGGKKAPKAEPAAAWARSDALSIFHALGKLLYNKRLPAQAPPPGAFPIAPALARPPPEARFPERVLAQAGLSSDGALSFLHENCLDFLGDDGDGSSAAALAEHLSDADWLLRSAGGRGGAEQRGGETEAEAVRARCAASLAARAVMCHNTHPAPAKFFQFRAPAGGAAARRAAEANGALGRAAARRCAGGDAAAAGGEAAAERLPFLRLLAQRRPEIAAALPRRWHTAAEGGAAAAGGAPACVLQRAGEGEEAEDPVED